MPINFLENEGSQIVDKVGEIIGVGQTQFHPQMIEKVLSLNETTKTFWVTFYSGDENDFKVHIGDKIDKFPNNYDMIYLSKRDKNFQESG